MGGTGPAPDDESKVPSLDGIFNNDPTAGTWLPVKNFTTGVGDSTTAPIDALLKSLGGHARLLCCWYNGARLAATRPFANGELRIQDSKWICTIEKAPVKEDPDALDLTLTFKLAEGVASSAGVAVAFDFAKWSLENYVFAPAVLYNGNRFRALHFPYPPFITNPNERPLDMPITVDDIVRLHKGNQVSKIELTTGNCSTPLLSFFDPKAKRGWIVLTEQGTRFGNSGMFVEENAAHDHASLVISAPGVREWRARGIGFDNSGDRAANWNAGDDVSLRLRLYNFPTNDIPAFMAKVFDIREALARRNKIRNIAPYSAIAKIVGELHDQTRWFENDKCGFCNSSNGILPTTSPGTAAWPNTLIPLTVFETPEHLRRASKNMGAYVNFMRARAGFLYSAYRSDGKRWSGNPTEFESTHFIGWVRYNGDALYRSLVLYDLLRRRGHADMVKPEWEAMSRAIADALVKLWKDYGQFGQVVDVDTGRMESNGSTAGATAITGLALASQYFRDPTYLEVAEAAGKFYYDRDVSKGYAGGAPGDILQAPDSEASYGITEAYAVLYEITGKEEWLSRACTAAHLYSTWVVSYDYKFPATSDLGRMKVNSSGAVWASVQNLHGAPGAYVSSGDLLLRIYRATGDKRYAELYRDTAHNIIQYVTTETNPLGRGSRPGSVSERVNLSDWEGKDHMGFIEPGDSNPAWELLVELTCIETPGIYLRTDAEDLFVFDHVEAQIVKRDFSGVTLTSPILPRILPVCRFSRSLRRRRRGHSAGMHTSRGRKSALSPGRLSKCL